MNKPKDINDYYGIKYNLIETGYYAGDPQHAIRKFLSDKTWNLPEGEHEILVKFKDGASKLYRAVKKSKSETTITVDPLH